MVLLVTVALDSLDQQLHPTINTTKHQLVEVVKLWEVTELHQRITQKHPHVKYKC